MTTSEPQFFVIVQMPNGPIIMKDEHDEIALFDSKDDVIEKLRNHAVVKAFGAEIYELGTGEWI